MPVLLLLLLPFAVLATAAAFYLPVRRQAALTSSTDVATFAERAQSSGGPRSTRIGIVLDLVFVAVFAAIYLPYLAAHGHWWWVPLAAAMLDVAEDALVLRMLARGASPAGVKIMSALSVPKIAAYLASVALAIWTLRGSA